MLPHDHIGIPSFSAGNSKQAFRRNFPKGIPSFFKGPLSLSRPLFQGFPAFFKRSLCFPSVIFQEIPMPFSRNRRDRHNNRFPKRYPLCQGHMIIRSLSLSLSLPLTLTSHIHINIHLPKHARLHASAIAPFCSRLMRHQVHSGIPPSLPTLFYVLDIRDSQWLCHSFQADHVVSRTLSSMNCRLLHPSFFVSDS